MIPPYSITPKALNIIAKISQNLGKIESYTLPEPSVELRRENRIRTIYSSLVIEGNSLSKKQVTAILDGNPVVGPQKDILEVKNAIQAYDKILDYNPRTKQHFLEAHKTLMTGLIADAGKIRVKNVGVIKENQVAHVAPKYTFVPKLIDDLFSFIKASSDINMLVLSSIIHYEIEFIHPFSDGNGRMGRLWQTTLLSHWNPLFLYLPIESLIRRNQKEYYSVLGQCDKAGDSTKFIEFMASIIDQTIEEFISQVKPVPLSGEQRVAYFQRKWDKKPFSRKNYIECFKTISTATASRDLIEAVDQGLLEKKGERNQTKYYFPN